MDFDRFLHVTLAVFRLLKQLKVIIRLEARLQSNIGFALWPILMMFTRSGITPESEPVWTKYNAGGWPWQILGAITAVATVEEPGRIFLSGK